MVIKGTRANFEPSEVLVIEGGSLYEAAFRFGQEMAENNRKYIDYGLGGLDQDLRDRILSEAERKLVALKGWSNRDEFVVGGENRLARYIEMFNGYIDGSGITEAEGAWLQIEVEAGCQSLFVQDGRTGEVRLIHTEEDTGPGFTANTYWYRWVTMKMPDKEIRFFAYPGLCSWGPAFGINMTTGMVEAVDDLYINSRYQLGPIWANVMAFMLLDVGKIELVEELVSKIQAIEGGKFDQGYGVQLVSTNGRPRLVTVEFAVDKIKLLEPSRVGDRLIVAQANCPVDDEIQEYSASAYPRKRKKWSSWEAELYVEMKERQLRLNQMGLETDWLMKVPEESIETGLKILADPRGDLGREWSGDHYTYYTSGLPSRVTVSHFVAYIKEGFVEYYVGKLLPLPIEGKEFEVKVDRNYRFQLKKIWEEAERERLEFFEKQAKQEENTSGY